LKESRWDSSSKIEENEPSLVDVGEQVLLAALVERMVHDNVAEAAALAGASTIFYELFKESLSARRCLQLMIDVGELHEGVLKELSTVEEIIQSNPQIIFKETAAKDSEGHLVRDTPLKRSVKNYDIYLLQKCLDAIKNDVHLLGHFIKQVEQVEPEIDLELEYDDYANYDAHIHEYAANADLFAEHYDELQAETAHKIGGTQRNFPRTFFDAICNREASWSRDAKFDECNPPARYLAYCRSGGQTEMVDITNLSDGLAIGKNCALARGESDTPVIIKGVLTEQDCQTDWHAWSSLFSRRKEQMHEVLENARALYAEKKSN
jgi:hypothetical protein